jgi:hypothetical protein
VSNVEGRTFYEKVEEWSVPLHDGEVVIGDVEALILRADKQVEEWGDLQYQDRYVIRAGDDRLFVQIRKEWKP